MGESDYIFLPIDWHQIHRDGKTLALKLGSMGPWKGIVAISRGGLVPATIVARVLNIRMVETVCMVAYGDDDSDPHIKDEIDLIKQAQHAGDGTGWLVIDDLVDSGGTFQLLRKMLPQAHFATLYAKPMGRPQVDTFLTEFTQDTWIYFPWEVEPKEE